MSRFRVLVTDEVDPEGLAHLRSHPDIEVHEKPTRPLAEVIAEIGEYDAFVGRSATRVTRELLQAGDRLKVIGRAGVGVDNIDLQTATELGIAVINAPGGNTVSVAELAFGVLLSLVRNIHVAVESMRGGRWDRSRLGGSELRGRTLAIIGLGRIGSEMARRARAFGMTLIAYDPFVPPARFDELGVERMERLSDAMDRADVVTVHTPLTAETVGLIGAPELARLGRGAIVLNLARGGIVAEDALSDALASGRIAGAALDVFIGEPLAADHPLRAVPNLILTPHLGASTSDAQRSVSIEACSAVRDALVTGDLSAAINAAGVGGSGWGELRPLLALSDRLGRLGRALLPGAVSALELRYTGPRGEQAPRPLLLSALQGTLRDVVDRRAINLVNAQHVATERGSRRHRRTWRGAASWAKRWSCGWRRATASSAWRGRCWGRRTAESSASAPFAWTWRRAAPWSSCATVTSPASSAAWAPSSARRTSTSPSTTRRACKSAARPSPPSPSTAASPPRSCSSSPSSRGHDVRQVDME
jgi:D-3-phosphoglycerate dehydrogenase